MYSTHQGSHARPWTIGIPHHTQPQRYSIRPTLRPDSQTRRILLQALQIINPPNMFPRIPVQRNQRGQGRRLDDLHMRSMRIHYGQDQEQGRQRQLDRHHGHPLPPNLDKRLTRFDHAGDDG